MYEWKDIPDCPGYQASSNGEIRSLDRNVTTPTGFPGVRKGVVLSQSVHPKTGYCTVSISLNGNWKTRTVHSLVAITFFGDRPSGLQVNHKDGNKLNNSTSNLEWISRSENRKHAFANGLQVSLKGEDTPRHVLTEDDVREIRALSGIVSQRELGKRYGVSYQTIGKAVRREKWKHVT